MSAINKSRMQTAFTVSIEAKKGITTGISAYDRAKTIKVAISKKVKKDIVSPGHVFPLISRNGGVLERAGHTEASVDISKLAKLNPSAVICEVMNEDGRMARMKDLIKFSKKHKIKIASIEDLISFKLKNQKLVYPVKNKMIKFRKNLEIKTYRSKLDNSNNFVIKKGRFRKECFSAIRVISINLGNKLNITNKLVLKSLNYLNKFKEFALIIIKDQKSAKQKILEQNYGNNILKYYGIGAQIIKDLGVRKMILISRSKKEL